MIGILDNGILEVTRMPVWYNFLPGHGIFVSGIPVPLFPVSRMLLFHQIHTRHRYTSGIHFQLTFYQNRMPAEIPLIQNSHYH